MYAFKVSLTERGARGDTCTHVLTGSRHRLVHDLRTDITFQHPTKLLFERHGALPSTDRWAVVAQSDIRSSRELCRPLMRRRCISAG